MQIRKATQADLPALMTFYQEMEQELGKQPFLPQGNRGGFPTRTMVEAAIAAGWQALGEEEGQIAGSYFLDHHGDPAYAFAPWKVEAKPEEVMVLHALRVLPAYGGRGYARALVSHAIETARSLGQKAIRLDCLEGNHVPMKMYLSCGFSHVGTAEITYADIGVPRIFHLFERPL